MGQGAGNQPNGPGWAAPHELPNSLCSFAAWYMLFCDLLSSFQLAFCNYIALIETFYESFLLNLLLFRHCSAILLKNDVWTLSVGNLMLGENRNCVSSQAQEGQASQRARTIDSRRLAKTKAPLFYPHYRHCQSLWRPLKIHHKLSINVYGSFPSTKSKEIWISRKIRDE